LTDLVTKATYNVLGESLLVPGNLLDVRVGDLGSKEDGAVAVPRKSA
jgi:hypothetical protein